MAITTCNKCNGTGIYVYGDPPITITCDQCQGVGQYQIPWTEILKRLDPPASKSVYTYQIVEATDDGDYANLTANQKLVYALIVSLGIVDLSVGSKVRAKLADMFGAGTTTRANLLKL